MTDTKSPKIHRVYLIFFVALILINLAVVIIRFSGGANYQITDQRPFLFFPFLFYFGLLTIGLLFRHFLRQHTLGFQLMALGILVAIFFDGSPNFLGQGVQATGSILQDDKWLRYHGLGRLPASVLVLMSAFLMGKIIDSRNFSKVVLTSTSLALAAIGATILIYSYLLPLFSPEILSEYLNAQVFQYSSVLLLLASSAKFFLTYLNTRHGIYFWFATAVVVMIFSGIYRTIGGDLSEELYWTGSLLAFSAIVIGLFEDNSRFVETERSLRIDLENSLFEAEKSAQNYELLLSRTDVGIGMIDHQNRITSVNKTILGMLGFDENQIVGKPFASLMDPKQKDKFKHEQEKWVKGEEAQFETDLVKKSGRSLSCLIDIIPNTGTKGDYKGARIALRNISTWKEAESELKSQTKKLERLVQEKADKMNRVSEELRRAISYYRSLLEGVSEIIMVVNNAGECTFLNQYGQNILGYTAKELNKIKIPDFFRDIAHMKSEYGRSIEVDLRDYEYTWKTKNGRQIPCIWDVRFMFDHKGEKVGTVGIGRDITLKKEMEQQLQQAREDFEKKIKETTSESEATTNRLSKVLEASKNLADDLDLRPFLTSICKTIGSFGWKSAAIILHDPDENKLKVVASHGPPQSKNSSTSYMAELADGKIKTYTRDHFKISNSYFVDLRKDSSSKESQKRLLVPIIVRGRKLGWLSAGDPLRGRKPGVDSVQIIERIAKHAGTIVELTQTLMNKVTQTHQLKRVDELKTEFLAHLSHELRTPLNSILSLSDILLNEIPGNLNSEQIKQMELVKHNGEKLLNLANDVLDMMKIESGSSDLSFSYFAVEPFLRANVAPFEPLCKNKRLKLDARIHKGVPSRIFGDKEKISQVLTNLLSNAVKFTDAGKVNVIIKAGERYSQLHFLVQDSGIGIPRDKLNSVFQDYKQLRSPGRKGTKGSGLGLSIAKKTSEILGGDISVTSKLKKGTTFDLILPMRKIGEIQVAGTGVMPAKERSPVPFQEQSKPRQRNSRTNLQPRKSDKRTSAKAGKSVSRRQKNGKSILIIDDDEGTRYAVKFYLEDKGFHVISAGDCETGLKIAESKHPNMILMDMVMPDLDGFEATRKLKSMRRTKNIPVLATTGRALRGDRKKALEAGCIDYISKPFTVEDLFKRIDKLLRD
jgi:PAS domain S-box-containing protein